MRDRHALGGGPGGKTPPLPGVPTAFVAKTLPFLAVPQVLGLAVLGESLNLLQAAGASLCLFAALLLGSAKLC